MPSSAVDKVVIKESYYYHGATILLLQAVASRGCVSCVRCVRFRIVDTRLYDTIRYEMLF